MTLPRRVGAGAAALLLALALTGCRGAERAQDVPPPELSGPAAAPEPAKTPEPEPERAQPPEHSPEPEPEPSFTPEPAPPEVPDEEFVRVLDYIPSVYTELKYATADNFTGSVIYDFTEAYLRYGTVKKLAAAQEILAGQGLGLLIWDAYRPREAQLALWEACPDPVYVANPETGNSSHSRGNTVDVTLVAADGGEMEMPTGFDDFSALADRDYSDVSDTARTNAMILESAMTQAGFEPYWGEWWHYSDSVSYPVP